MKHKIRMTAILLSVCLLFPVFATVSHAASGSISISSKSGNVGSNVTVTCTIKCSSGPIGSADVTLRYDQSGVELVSATGSATGGAGSVHFLAVTTDGTSSSLSFSMVFKILKAGSHKITVSTADAWDIDETQFTPSYGTGTITGKVPNTTDNDAPQNNKDSNAKLSSLQVYPGTLAPAFDAGTTDYTVTVPDSTTGVTISAVAQSSKATVQVTGGTDLKLGINEAKVVVTAENGATLAYNIIIMCGEPEKIQINGQENTIDEGFAEEEIPLGFTRAKALYKDREYEALKNESGDLTLMSLQNESGSAFYIYNEETQGFYAFVQILLSEENYIVLLPREQGIEEFAEAETVAVLIQGRELEAWKLDEEYSVVCAVNQSGEEVFYQYDSVDGTFQRYKKVVPVEKIVIKSWLPEQYYMYVAVGLGSLVLILFISMVCALASRRRWKKRYKNIESDKKTDYLDLDDL